MALRDLEKALSCREEPRPLMMADFQFALQYAETHHRRVILVVPAVSLDQAMTALVSLAGEKYRFGGTVLRVGEGSLMVAPVEGSSPGGSFDVLFCGWGALKATKAEEMGRWRQAARQVLHRA